MARASAGDAAPAAWLAGAPLALSRRLGEAQLVAHAALSDVLARVAALGGGGKPSTGLTCLLDALLRRPTPAPASRLARVRAQGAARAQGCTTRVLLAEAAKHERCGRARSLAVRCARENKALLCAASDASRSPCGAVCRGAAP